MTREFYYETAGSRSQFRTFGRDPRQRLMHILSLLGGPERSTFFFARVPDGVHFFQHLKNGGSSIFLQAAGTAETMTIECRRLDDDGGERLYVLGHGGPRSAEPTVRIEFNDGQNHTLVYPDEVFDASEAGEIFFSYFQTERVPDKYALRLFDLDAPFDDQRSSAD
ncbi:hypothetical protein [uncultured Microbacterium sp.]|uniref:hypothetical protein n=1 Tax=uncultured Microbacterium sp. TaxID=191216 RepID=UPI0025FC621B|nr:hypothetical protein [uncultured Microbacterium sp.]